MKKQSFCKNWLCNGSPVTLPHDAMLHTQRRADAPSGSAGAFFAEGSWVYEKKFERPEAEHVLLQFEGVYKNAKVFLNGKQAGGAAYGYIPFWIDADEYLVDGENTLRVECAVQHPDSRWYSGAGIYRPVWLWTGPKNSIEPERVRVSTLGIDPPRILLESESPVRAEAEGISGEGTRIELELPGAALWSAETPALHTLHLRTADDSLDICFGIRKIEWSARGLLVNGKSVKLRGGCIHHDSGILGAATYDEGEWRRVRRLKEAGFNAIRSAHNPCSRATLEACDGLGMYVMDEAWDMWYKPKNKYDYSGQWQANHLEDLTAMVRRDFNHPSVLLYSIGNEVSEPAKEKGIAAAKEMVSHLHRLDPTRPVSGGMNLMILSRSAKGKDIYDENGEGRDESKDKKAAGMSSTMFNLMASMVGTGMNKAANGKKADAISSPVLDALDIAGYNYASGRYPMEGKAHPNRLIFGSETFPQDIAKNWAMVEQYPYLCGDFMWTAWDYLGEAGIGAWAYTQDGTGFNKPYPWLLADTGAMDILGDPNGELFHAAAVWGTIPGPRICVQPLGRGRKPAKAVWRGTNAIPSWSWKGCEGETAVVEVYAKAAKVTLWLNGKELGTKAVKDCKATFKVRYAPGTLSAAAYDAGGREIGRDELRSAEGKLKLTVIKESEHAKPGEIVYIPVMLTGENGAVESNSDRKLRVTAKDCELLAFGSANPRTEERFDAGEYTTYYGRALAVVRAGEDGCTALTIQEMRA